jgi:hypothetical protein
MALQYGVGFSETSTIFLLTIRLLSSILCGPTGPCQEKIWRKLGEFQNPQFSAENEFGESFCYSLHQQLTHQPRDWLPQSCFGGFGLFSFTIRP